MSDLHTAEHDKWDADGYCNELVMRDGEPDDCGYNIYVSSPGGEGKLLSKLMYEPSPYEFDLEKAYRGSDLDMMAVMLRVGPMSATYGPLLFDKEGDLDEYPVEFDVPEELEFHSDTQWWAAGKVEENDLHVTLKYGLMPDTQDGQIKEVLGAWKYPPHLSVERFEVFRNPNYDVVVARVVSPALSEAHNRLSCLPHIDFHAQYRAHVTLAYVAKGYGKSIIDKFIAKNFPTESSKGMPRFIFPTKDIFWGDSE